MFELKPISSQAIPRAIEKAERYRLLNDSGEAESICLDILDVDPENQKALVVMLLAVTDQFADFSADLAQARAVLPRLRDAYARAYYAGIVAERWAKAHLRRGDPGSGFLAYEAFREAMDWYQKAEAVRPPDNADAILRWNACVRILNARPELQRGPEEPAEAPLE